MRASASNWKIALIGLLAISGLAIVGVSLRRGASRGCALDGAPINPLLRVRAVDRVGQSFEFCCIRCAEIWLRSQHEAPRQVFVTDEVSGLEIDAGKAYFVRSQVATNAATGNRVHTFEREEDAERHANAYGGSILPMAEHPF